MKRWKVLAIIIALVTGVTLLCACSSNQSNQSTDEGQPSYSREITISAEGSYFLYRTDSGKEYVDFLESLDKEMYEIVNITIQPTTYYREDCFMITYTKRT